VFLSWKRSKTRKIILFFISEWIGKEAECPLFTIGQSWKRPFRWVMYYALIFIVFFFAGDEQGFIYFQF
jgi:hypothetical protein